MTGARREEAIELEQSNTWTCECGYENPMNSFQINRGGPAECRKRGCKLTTEL